MTKLCRWCGHVKPLEEFYTHPQMRDGRLNKCCACVKAYAQHRRLTSDRPREIDNRRYHEGKKDPSDYSRRFPERAAVSHRASQIVCTAIRKGQLTRPTICEQCGQPSARIEAAHHDYSKPLDVRWLCQRCHRRWDAEQPKTAVFSCRPNRHKLTSL